MAEPRGTGVGGAAQSLQQLKEQRAAKERKAQLAEAKVAMRPMHRPGVVPTAASIPAKPAARPLTVPKPFFLITEARWNNRYNQEQQLEKMAEASRNAAAQFKASVVMKGNPFMPSPARAPLTIPTEPTLSSTMRAADRGHFDATIKEKEKKAKARAEAEKLRVQRREAEDTKRFRMNAMFRALPMPDFWDSAAHAPKRGKPQQAEPKQATKPKSPKLATSKRRRIN